MLKVSLLGVATVLRLARDAWSMVIRLRQATTEYAPPLFINLVVHLTSRLYISCASVVQQSKKCLHTYKRHQNELRSCRNVYIFTNAVQHSRRSSWQHPYKDRLPPRTPTFQRHKKDRNLTFCGAGVPDEHNDANPTHNVMNTHTHGQVLYSSRKKIKAPSGFTFVRDWSMGFADSFDRD